MRRRGLGWRGLPLVRSRGGEPRARARAAAGRRPRNHLHSLVGDRASAVRAVPPRAGRGRANSRRPRAAHHLLDDELLRGALPRRARRAVRAGSAPPRGPVPSPAPTRAHVDPGRPRSDEIQIGRRRVRLTHPERVLFPGDGVTKGDLAEYYVEIGDAIVPHLRDRPFTLKRYPHGIHGQPYFHKQAPKGKPWWIPTRQFRTWPRAGESRLVDFTLVNETAALIWMVQMNCVDMNAW